MATYAATDFHGMYGVWKKIKEYMKPDDTLYYLGDAIDRGPRGWDVFTELLDDPRVIYIKGNHEDMMYNVFTCSYVVAKDWLKHWDKNGGKTTRKNMQGVSYETRMYYINKIPELPTFKVFQNEQHEVFLLTHAGCTPTKEYWDMDDKDWQYSNLWNRRHIADPWPQDKNNEHKFVVHGHTPVQLMFQLGVRFERNDTGMPTTYCNKHKINLDCGTYDTNIATLYNLDFNCIETIFRGDFEDEHFDE